MLVLILLVRQMESTRTPSTLAKVSLGAVTIMFVADSWIFSAHAVIGIMSDNKTSLPLLVPAFLFLCSAVVFGPVSAFRGKELMPAICGAVASDPSAGASISAQSAETEPSTSSDNYRRDYSITDSCFRRTNLQAEYHSAI